MKKLLIALIAVLCFLEFLIFLGFLDMINILDYGGFFGSSFEGHLALSCFFLSMLGIILGMIILLTAKKDFKNIKLTKILIALLYVNPFLFMLIFIFRSVFSYIFRDGVLYVNSSGIVASNFFFLLLVNILLLLPIYFFKINWGQVKKIFFGIFNLAMGFIVSVLILCIIGFGMNDNPTPLS